MKTIVLLSALSISGLAQANDHLAIEDAWIREAPPGAQALAGYMKLHNHSSQAREVLRAESPAFAKVMLHKTVFEGNITKMVHQRSITVPAKGMVSFEPNGYHLMMMKPKHALHVGDRVTVTLSFKNGETMDVAHEVRGTMSGGSMDHGKPDHHQH